MTEQELYDALAAYRKEHGPDEGRDERPSFMVMVTSENDERTTIAVNIIDPEIPPELDGPPMELSIAQQTLVYLKRSDELDVAINEAQDSANKMKLIFEMLGKERIMQIVAVSDGKETFGKLMQRALKMKQEEIESHGTG